MKAFYIGLVSLLVSSPTYAAVQCPDISLIRENLEAFLDRPEDNDNFEKGKIMLDGKSWTFDSNLTNTEVSDIKSLNPQIDALDERTCNYLLYPADTALEDASLALTLGREKPQPD
jgi:hypothetical protein